MTPAEAAALLDRPCARVARPPWALASVSRQEAAPWGGYRPLAAPRYHLTVAWLDGPPTWRRDADACAWLRLTLYGPETDAVAAVFAPADGGPETRWPVALGRGRKLVPAAAAPSLARLPGGLAAAVARLRELAPRYDAEPALLGRPFAWTPPGSPVVPLVPLVPAPACGGGRCDLARDGYARLERLAAARDALAGGGAP